MVSTVGVGLLVLVTVALAAVYLTMKVVKPLVINSVLGVIALLIVNFTGFVDVEITTLPVLIIAIGGVPGFALVVLLSYFGIAFV